MAKKEKDRKPTRKKVTASKTAAKVAPRKKEKAVAKPKKTAGIFLKAPLTPKKAMHKPVKVEPLTKEDLEHYRHLLLEKRAELLGDVNSIESEALKKSRLDAAGDLSSMPIHMADLGTDNFEQEFSLGLMASERKLLSEINAALKRIDDGSFGVCEGTGEPISRNRLEANPWARYTIDYASRMEKGGYFESSSGSSYSTEEDSDDHEDEQEESEEAESSEEETETEEETPSPFDLEEEEEEEEKEEKEF